MGDDDLKVWPVERYERIDRRRVRVVMHAPSRPDRCVVRLDDDRDVHLAAPYADVIAWWQARKVGA